MSDYMNLTGPSLGDLGVGGAPPPVLQKPAAAPTIPSIPVDHPSTAHETPDLEARLSGNLAGLLGDSLDQINPAGVPLSRDVLALDSGRPTTPAAPPSDVLASAPAAISPQALGLDTQSVDLAAAPSVEVAGDRTAYQQRYDQITDVLGLQQPTSDLQATLGDLQGVALQPDSTPPLSEAKKLDRLVSLMAQGVDISKAEDPLLSQSPTVVNKQVVDSISSEPYTSVGTFGVHPSLGGTAADPAGPLSDALNGSIS